MTNHPITQAILSLIETHQLARTPILSSSIDAVVKGNLEEPNTSTFESLITDEVRSELGYAIADQLSNRPHDESEWAQNILDAVIDCLMDMDRTEQIAPKIDENLPRHAKAYGMSEEKLSTNLDETPSTPTYTPLNPYSDYFFKLAKVFRLSTSEYFDIVIRVRDGRKKLTPSHFVPGLKLLMINSRSAYWEESTGLLLPPFKTSKCKCKISPTCTYCRDNLYHKDTRNLTRTPLPCPNAPKQNATYPETLTGKE